MQFDDRLRTVLGQRPSSPHDAAVRWRHLVELVARSADADQELINQALNEIRIGFPRVDESVRLAAALSIAPLAVPADLVAIFASNGFAAAAPVLSSARLTSTEWTRVAGAASEECRAFIAAMRADSSQKPAQRTPQAAAQPLSPQVTQKSAEPQAAPRESPPKDEFTSPKTPDSAAPDIPTISEVVARIERLRQSRSENAPSAPDKMRIDDEPKLFRWECNESGQIDWVDGAPRGALIGLSIAKRLASESQSERIDRAFTARAPFRDLMLDLVAGSTVSGTWKVSGVPAFDRTTGRFAGYRGIAERSAFVSVSNGNLHRASVRELAHEIRTPLNAIIGFAEIICGEYLGPAEIKYKERAAEIVRQAKLLLGGIEDLDLVARKNADSNNNDAVPRTRVEEIFTSLIPTLDQLTRERDVRLEISQESADVDIAIDREVAERLIQRVCHGVIEWTGEGETLHLWVETEDDSAFVLLSRPRGPDSKVAASGLGRRVRPSEGFAFRFARGLAKVAGAELTVESEVISLRFPIAD